MSELHEALSSLKAGDFSDIPLDNLSPYLQRHFQAGELICNSVPSPAGGDDFASSSPSVTEIDNAKSSKEMTVSEARPTEPHPSHVDLQKSWGKPLKINAKDNPLGVSVYKMAGNDRHGAWFARKSVHEGLSFSKFRQAMRWEFAESLTVEGGAGAGAVRGLAGDKRLEKKKVEGVGNLEVYQLSAQFPGPVAPREFIPLVMTSDNALSEKSAAEGQPIPRHHMIVSKPITHPDAPSRSDFIRGFYESVELIREIPLHEDQKNKDSAKAELNPVEWIMITRSDPGGGIPRFLVERGTPGGICADVPKFLDWACGKSKDEIPDPDDEGAVEQAAEKHRNEPPPPATSSGDNVGASGQTVPSTHHEAQAAQQGGIASHMMGVLEAGLESYAPTSVSNAARGYLHPEPTSAEKAPIESDYDSDSISTSSYESADDHLPSTNASNDTLAISRPSSPDTLKSGSRHDKELQKIASQQRKLNRKLEKKRQAETSKLKSQQEKETSEQSKAQEKHDKEIKKTEEKHAKDVAKLEAKREKELDKVRKKREKALNRDTVSKVSRERDDFKERMGIVQRENEVLREQLGEAQRENTALVQRLSKVAGGDEVMRSVREELEAARKGGKMAGSMKSGSSGGSS